jgi:glycosyltransferase involved in cell wall biosynthesis
MIAATRGAVGDAPRSGANSVTRRVLSVVHYPVYGGPHNLALRLAAPLRAHGWETIVLLPDEPGNAAGRLRAVGVEVVTMALHHLRAVPDPRIHLGHIARIAPEVRAIRRLIRERGIDLVQIAGLVNPQAAIAARFEHVPVVWQLLDTRAPWPVALVSMAFVRELADAVMSTGRSVAASHPGISAVEDRLVIFFPPVDVEVFRPRRETRQAVRAEWGVPDESPVVGCVANINPQKGTLDLVRAFTLVRTRIPNARLILVGAEFPTHAAYSRLVHEAVKAGGLVEGRDVIFLDSRPDHERQLAGFDVFAFAPVPRGEGITTAVLEAMATALPVVTTAVAGLPEAIESGVNGRLVPPLDPAALADAIVQVLTDPVYAARLGDAGRVRALERFTTDRCVEDHLRAYNIAFRGHGRRAFRRSG